MSTSTARKTVASAHARIDSLDAKVDRILALVEAQAPARTRKPARKAPAKKAPAQKAAPKPTRTQQPKADLGRKGWNRALTGLARSKGQANGSSVYSQVTAQWETAQAHREAGMTPAQALVAMGF